MPDEAREKTFHDAYRLEREVDDIVPNAVDETAYLVPQERGQVDMRKDKLHAFNRVVETGARRSEDARPARGLIPREHKKAYEERKRDEDENKMRH